MDEICGAPKASIQDYPRIQDRLSFLYVEKCTVSRKDSAVIIKDRKGYCAVPSAQISVLLLGPGTSITHRAMELIGESGVSVAWIGEGCLRYFAGGRSLSSSSRLIMRQADYVSHPQKHLDIVRKMYSLRFPDEDLNGLTLAQLRGKEGRKMRDFYYSQAIEYGVPWSGRNYDPYNFEQGDPVNQALSCANYCLYGLTHAVLCSLGLSPALGFIHVGHELSLVYDVADLYKTEISIPLAFKIAASRPRDIAGETRRQMRDAIHHNKLLIRMVKDLYFLFDDPEDPWVYPEISLWTTTSYEAEAGKLYGV